MKFICFDRHRAKYVVLNLSTMNNINTTTTYIYDRIYKIPPEFSRKTLDFYLQRVIYNKMSYHNLNFRSSNIIFN